MSEIRSEKDDIESEMDMEHAAELQSLRKSLGQQTERQMQTMEDQTLEKLKAETGNKINTLNYYVCSISLLLKITLIGRNSGHIYYFLGFVLKFSSRV